MTEYRDINSGFVWVAPVTLCERLHFVGLSFGRKFDDGLQLSVLPRDFLLLNLNLLPALDDLCKNTVS